MKYLELSLTDFELYHLNGNTDFIEHLESNISMFKKLYYDQGEDFWLRHLLNLREYLYVLIRAKFEHEDGLCLHWILNPLEKIFIQMHNLIIVKGFDAIKKSFKSLKRNVKKTNLDVIPYLTHREKWQLITSCSIKMAYKSLFGFNMENSKSTTIKIYLAVDLYKYFCKTVSVLLKRYATAISSNNNKQYWKPFSYWDKKGYEAELFENYLARVYKENLCEKVLLPRAYQIFHCKYSHQCCERFIKQCSLKILEGNRDFYKQKIYQTCNKHNSCFLRFVHAENCKSPHFCALKKTCSLMCDTEVYEKNLESMKDEQYWKSHIVVTYPNPDNNCRDVNTLTETHECIKKTEHYPTHTVNYDFDEENESALWRELPPDFANFAKQLERKEKTKSRLRDKLSKKTRSSSRDECPCHSTDILTPFSDPNFRVSMFYHAKNLFRDELADELLCRLFKDKVGKSDTPLIDIFEGRYEINDLCSKELLSVSVGSNVPCNHSFLTNAKIIHIQKRLQLKHDTPISDKSCVFEISDNNCSISKNDMKEISVNNPSIERKGKHNKKTKGFNLDATNCKISSNGSEISDTAENLFYPSEAIKCVEAKENSPKHIASQIELETDTIVSENSVGNSEKMNTNELTEIKENSSKQIKTLALGIESEADVITNKNCIKNSEEDSIKVNSEFIEATPNSPVQIKTLALGIEPKTDVIISKNCMKNSEEDNIKVNSEFIEATPNSSKQMKTLVLRIESKTDVITSKNCIKNSEEDNMKVYSEFIEATTNSPKQIKTLVTQFDPKIDVTVDKNSEDNICETNAKVTISKSLEVKESSSKQIEALTMQIEPKLDTTIYKKGADQEVKELFDKFVSAEDYSSNQLEAFLLQAQEIMNAAEGKNQEIDMKDSDMREFILKHMKTLNLHFPKTKITHEDLNNAQQVNMEKVSISRKSKVNGFSSGFKMLLNAINTEESESNNEETDLHLDQKNSDHVNLSKEFADCPYLIKGFTECAKAIELAFARQKMTQNGYNRVNRKPLRICAYCGKLELSRHAFKKCKFCKDHNFKYPHYYCSGICQVKDWKEKHQSEHGF